MKTLVKNIEYNSDLVGYILTLQDGRVVQIQAEYNNNRLHADHGTFYAVIDKINDYGLDITDDEAEQIMEYVDNNKEIQKWLEDDLELNDGVIQDKECCKEEADLIECDESDIELIPDIGLIPDSDELYPFLG